jgi:LuxR family maltose regulon positive regulatory protein
MTSSLVATKFAAPRLRSALVPRPRLSELMDAGADATLTLVSAPAGFGKTTALASWLSRVAAEPRALAWVSLDRSDNQATSFWLYVVTALNAAMPGVGSSVLPLLDSGQPATRTVLTAVLNEIVAQPAEVDLILDDYHLADGADVAEGMTFVLEHRPLNLHVVIATRSDPDLPLARLRARGELVEIRSGDLRFTGDEASSFLTDVGGLQIAPEAVAALESRTEGWAAALQLAALSMQGRDDVGAFVAGFAGTDRHVVDYLVDEVLSQQSDEVRDFLERTSILDLLGGELCDAVLERTGSKGMLEQLERANLFLVPLDDQRSWYRYHHLFADVLQAHLRGERPDLVSGLHLRASRWYESVGDPVPAVRHALSAGDLDRAADLVETATPALRRDRQEATLRSWVDDFPDEIRQWRPVLALGFVGALMSSNDFADVARRLREIEHHLPAIDAYLASGGDVATRHSNGVVAVDDAELARVPAAVELYWAGLSLVSGDLPSTHVHARRAIETATPDDDVVPAGAAGLSGLAHWACGELDDAHRSYLTCIDGLLRAKHVPDALGCYLTVAEIQMAQGRLRDAQTTCNDAERVAGEAIGEVVRGMADIHVGRAQLALQRGDLGRGRESLAAARALGDARGLPAYAYRSRATAAMLAEAEGDIAGALELVAEAQQVYLGDFSPNVRPLHATAARLQIRLGDLDAAERWAHDHDVTAEQELTYLHEYEHVTLAEALLARYHLADDRAALVAADSLLQRLLDAAAAGGRDATVIEILVLRAVIAGAGDDVPGAHRLLDRAVRLAEPEGEVRSFTRHGPLVVPLLEALATSPGSSSYARTLAMACAAPATDTRVGGAAGQQRAAQIGPVEALSSRELEVLTLLATELDGPEIARHLFVSLNTVRTHTKSIYAKLGVNSRRAAVRRSGELGLLSDR